MTTTQEKASTKAKIRKGYQVGQSYVVAIASPLVKELNIDDKTFFEEEVHPEGILLKIRRLV